MKELDLFNSEPGTTITPPLNPRILELKNTKHNFWNDPGHGWLEVNRADLRMMGIDKKISGYSYQKDDKVYLEEDCDMSLYIETLYIDDPIPANMQNFCRSCFVDQYREKIFIRSLHHYRP